MKTLQNLMTVVAVLVATITSAQTTSENYVQTTAYQTEVQDGQQSQVLESDKIVSVNYFDGLGRAKQSVAVRAGGQQQNTNILDWTDDWKTGSGSTPLFNQNGQTSENQRIFGTNPFGEQSLLWRCGNDSNNDADGGWNTDYIAVDKNVAYRYTVWVKRTGSQNGNTYHGTQNVNNLSGTANNNPYFWHGDMPNLNQWYLLVGIIHPYTYTGSNSGMSGVYDINGNKVKSGNDYKWRNNTINSRFRSYLYYATDTGTRQYFWNPVLTKIDGNGEPIIELLEQTKPKDIITHYEYDTYGRKAKEYLPYASDDTQNGAIYTNPLTELNAFYNTPKYQNTPNPYSETIFEASPLSRPLKQAAPGLDWQAKISGDDHTIKLDRTLNIAADNVVYFKVNYTSGNTLVPTLQKVGNYPANELFVSITKDENWSSSDGNNHTTKEYTDKRGRVILKRTYNSNVEHDTYYVYDDFGNLSYVFPPKVTVDNGISGTELNELGYQYRYDQRNRLVEKKIPGMGWEYIVYNKLDQPVMTQDANQRAKSPKEWLFTKYDAFGRVAYTGIIKNNSSRAAQQTSADTNTTYTQFENRQTGNSTLAGTTLYYSNNAIPRFIDQILTINYYDNYTFDRDGLSKPASVYGVATTNTTKGLVTGSKVRILGTDQWITTVMAYDAKGQVIWTGNRNDYLNTTDITESLLDFTGKPIKVKTTHTKGSNAAIVTTDTFTYDHMGRVLTQKQQIGSHPEELIVQNNYDELGQLESKKVGNAEQAPLQTVDYKYNVRGWLTDINDVNSIGDDLFTFKISYNKPTVAGIGVPALFNGNISETQWKTKNDNTKRAYGYLYDNLNRLKISRFTDNMNAYTGQYNTTYVYDKMGNMLTLLRNTTNGVGSYNQIDNLSYSYSSSSNKLLRVTDNNSSTLGFYDGNKTGNDYAYDVNGNMTIDRNKGITGISYNHLNLPTSVAINDQVRSNVGNISYIYDATGVKQKKIVSGGSSLTTEYAGNYIYENGQLQFMSTTEGYVEPIFAGNGVAISSFDYIYQYKDHLGNIRLSYSDKNNDGNIVVIPGSAASEILEENNYYPFGLKHKGYNSLVTDSNKALDFKYNGVELEESLGLNLYEMPLRQYDPTIARWTGIDPVTHHSLSPYNAFDNNPVFWADPSGANSEDLINDIWNNSSSGSTTWTNTGNGSFSDGNGNTVTDNSNSGDSSNGSSEGGILNADGTCCANSGSANSVEHRTTLARRAHIESLSDEEREAYLEKEKDFYIAIGALAIPIGGAIRVIFRGGKWIVTLARGGKLVTTTVSSSRFVKLLKPVSEFDEAVTLFRGTTGSEAGSLSLFLTDNAAVAATYVKNGGQVVSYRVSQYALKFLEQSGSLNRFKGIHKATGAVNNEFQFIGKELVEALNKLANPLK
ncbi:DUF6443 domain-containing protein [Aquimarina litoralis]|uniref:DUF6443 domain-containing protein n=1 Tax=Aquimarina litoralis TaxID=584605 RepID=UPI001C5995EC|nr:DUF6443 domain-containing protein [Aquimarina litoralis]